MARDKVNSAIMRRVCSIKRLDRYAWSHWETELTFEKRGYYEIWARAYDDTGDAQPFNQPWNPKGYLGNVIHRVPISIIA